MNKEHEVDEAIKQSKKLNKANIPFNSIVMYGITRKDESIINALATAEMINSFKTNKIITMNLIIMEGTDLDEMVKNDELVPPGRKERLIEIKTLIENLKPKYDLIFYTTHPSNIIKIDGVLPKDRNKLLNIIETNIRALG